MASEMSTEQNGNEFLIILGKVFWGAAQFPRYNLKESIPTKWYDGHGFSTQYKNSLMMVQYVVDYNVDSTM